METTHELKTWPLYFKEIAIGRKSFEIRFNDRDFQVGDMLRLREWGFVPPRYTGAEITARIVYKTGWEQKPGYVVLGLGGIEPSPQAALYEALKALVDDFRDNDLYAETPAMTYAVKVLASAGGPR